MVFIYLQKIMKKRSLNWDKNDTLSLLEASLTNNKVILGDSDTVLGLLAQVSIKGKLALDTVKIRENKPYIVLINSIDKLDNFISQDINPNLQKLIQRCWPGPLTLIFNCNKNIFYLNQETVAIRIPNHQELLKLLKFFPGLFSTSANLSGQPVPKSMDDVDLKVLEKVDYIVENKQKYPTLIPSTILDCTGQRIKVVREGAYDIKELEEIYGEPFIKEEI